MNTNGSQGAASPALVDKVDQISPDRLKGPDPRPGRKSPRVFLHPGAALKQVIARARWTPAPPPRVPGAGPTWG